MIRIDHLNLQLPAGYEGRAHAIVQLIATELANHPVGQNARYEHLALAKIHIDRGCSDKHVASAVASQIHRHVLGPKGKNHG
ncbi:MAG: hypothetical protein R8K53_00565 [Mariprofundaceae bacterium]